MPRLPEADRWYAALIWLVALQFPGADWSGLHFMVGAFLAGAMHRRANGSTRKSWICVRHTVLVWLMPVFFLVDRVAHHLGGGRRSGVRRRGRCCCSHPSLGNWLACSLAGRWLELAQRARLRVIGWLLQTKALIMIIFANILLDKASSSSATFTALLLMAVASTALTVPMVRGRMASTALFGTRRPHD